MGIKSKLVRTAGALRDDGACYLTPDGMLPRMSHVIGDKPNYALEMWKMKLGEEAAARISRETAHIGDVVHKATELSDLGQHGGLETLYANHEWVIPFSVAWDEWTYDRIKVWFAVEVVVWSVRLGIAGRIDRVGIVMGDAEPAIIDIKTGSLNDEIGLKLWTYRTMWNEMVDRKLLRRVPKVKRLIAVGLERYRDKETGEVSYEFNKRTIKEYTKYDRYSEELERMARERKEILA